MHLARIQFGFELFGGEKRQIIWGFGSQLWRMAGAHQLMPWRCFPSSTPRAGHTHLQASRRPGAIGSPFHRLGNRSCSVHALHMDCHRAVGFPERQCGCAPSRAAALQGKQSARWL